MIRSLSSFFICLCVRALLRLKKKLSSQKAPFPSLVPFPASRRLLSLFIPIFSLSLTRFVDVKRLLFLPKIKKK